MKRFSLVLADLRSIPGYIRDLAQSWWVLVCLAGTVLGLVLPFLPPLQSAIPPWVGVAIALVFWTLAPLRAYSDLKRKVEELNTRSGGTNVEGVLVEAGSQSNVNVRQGINPNITNNIFLFNVPPTKVVEQAWKDVTIAEQIARALEAAGAGPELAPGLEQVAESGPESQPGREPEAGDDETQGGEGD